MTKSSPETEVVEVPNAWDMDDETFLLHLEKRHATDCKVESFISRNAVSSWIGTYRAFHDRLHQIEVPGQYDHVHEEDEEIEDEEEEG